MNDLERIRINETQDTSAYYLPIIRARNSLSGILTTTSDEWYVTEEGRDVTDEYILGPPGNDLTNTVNPKTSKTGTQETLIDPKEVFVVHGRNSKAHDAMFSFLESIGLTPKDFFEGIRASGKPTPYIGEALDAAFSKAQAIIVLMTPDDEGRVKKEFRKQDDPVQETELTGQARLNVIFEAGMAMGHQSERTVIVEIGSLRPFSDLGGRHVLRLTNDTKKRQELAQRLMAAGCNVDLTDLSWHTEGNFDCVSEHADRAW